MRSFISFALASVLLATPAAAQSISGTWTWTSSDGVMKVTAQLMQTGMSASGTITVNESTLPVRGSMIETLLMGKLGADGKVGHFQANLGEDGLLFSEIALRDPSGGKDRKMRFHMQRAIPAPGEAPSAGAGGFAPGSVADRAYRKMLGAEMLHMKEQYWGFEKSDLFLCANGSYTVIPTNGNRLTGSWRIEDRNGSARLILMRGASVSDREITMDNGDIVYLDGDRYNKAGDAGC